MTRITSLLVSALALFVLLTAPAAAVSDDMKAAIRAMDAHRAVALMQAGEEITSETYRVMLQVASVKAAQQPHDVYWRAQLGRIIGYFVMGSGEPDEETIKALKAAIDTDDPVLKAQGSLAGAIRSYIEYEGVFSNEDYRRHLANGASPLRRPHEGDYDDVYASLIYTAMVKQYGENVSTPEKTGNGKWRGFVNEVWDDFIAIGAPPRAARYFLDAAMTPYDEDIVFSADDGSPESEHIKWAVAEVRAGFDNGGIEGNIPAWDEAYTQYIRTYPEK